MRPFGYHVSILSTLDSLEKFDGKVDEGFRVGYSVSSKAFRVFNSRTRIVQETLHVNFFKNKPNVAGSGPIWLFNINSLTRIINYQPVTKRNQTNPSAGFQDKFDAKKVGEEIDQQYVLFPVWSSDSTNPLNNDGDAAFDGNENDFDAKKPNSKVNVSPNSSAQSRKQDDKTKKEAKGKKADFNNLESSITFSPIPTTRVHKDHPVSQLIAIGTKWVYINKKDERGMVIRNKARLVSQGHMQDKGIYYEEVFALVARIDDIRLFLAYAFFMGFMVYQIDVKSAFLYGTIVEEVYVCQPPGFEDPDHLDKVYKVVKALYGLHQAHRASSTPIDTEKPLLKDLDGEDVDVHTYRSMIGSLMYLTSSRPEIMFTCKKQTVVATSSVEAEYIAVASYCAQVLWIQNQLLDYGVKKLKKRNKVRVLKLRRLQRFGTSQRVDTSDDTVIDDESNQGRMIAKLDEDDVVVLKGDKEEDKEVANKDVEEVKVVKIHVATLIAAAKRVAVAPSRKRKGVVIMDPESESTTSTIIPAKTKSKDKGKGIMVEEPKPLKKKQQIKLDEQYARELHAKLNKDIDWDKAINHVKRKAKEDPAVKRYQVLKRKPQTEAQARMNMIMYLKNVAGFKMDYFKGTSYNDIRLIFEAKFNSNVAFLLKKKEQIEEEEENKAPQKLNKTLVERATKRRILDEEVEELRRYLKIMPNEDDDVYTEATPLVRKVPVVDYQERFSTSKPKNFSDDFLLVTLGAMFEKLDIHAQIWKNQRTVHGPTKVKGWKLLESCGVQIIMFTSTQLILLVKKKYPLIRFTLDQMLNVVRLEVEEESEVSLELLRNGPISVITYTKGMIKVLPPKTIEYVMERERERKARATLLMALPEDHLAKFHKMVDAKEMWEPINSGFGSNDESKKMQKYLLKKPFEGFSVPALEGLHKGYDRFQTLLSQLEIHDDGVSYEDANQNFDDLYNNLRVFERDVKGTTASSSSNTHDVAFISANNTSSTNDVSIAYSISFPSVLKSQKEGSASYNNEVIHSFFANQSRHFARDYRAKWSQDNRRRDGWYNGNKARDNNKRLASQDDSKALVTIDGEAVDWSRHVEEDTQNFAMMAYSLSNLGFYNEVQSCSKTCADSYAKLKKLYDEQRDKLGDASIEITAYTLALKKSVFMNKECDLENTLVNNRYAKGMHAVPLLMIWNYMPSGPDVEIDYSKFIYGPKQTSANESDFKSIDNASSASDSSVETTTSMPAPVEDTPKVVSKPKVWTNAPIIKEYESDSDDDLVLNVQENIEKSSFAFIEHVKHVKSPRENVKEPNTPNHCPKIEKQDRHSHTRKGLGYARKSCFVCGSFSHLIRDCDFHEKRMAKQAALTKSKEKGEIEILLLRPQHVVIGETKEIIRAKSSNTTMVKDKQKCKRSTRQTQVRDGLVNKAHLIDYQEFKGGPVTVRGSNGRITRKEQQKLVDSMNYEPVSLENQVNKSTSPQVPNHNAGTQANADQGVNSEEIDLHDEHFVLPIWSAYLTFVKSSRDKIGKNEKPVSPVEQIFQEELKKLNRQEKKANDAVRKEATNKTQDINTNSTNPLTTVSAPVSAVGPSRALNDDEPSYPDDPLMPHLKDIYASPSACFFTNSSYDNEGVVTDFNNLETTMNVRPTPITKIHTIYHKTQILGDPLSAVKKMSKAYKNSEARALWNPKRSFKHWKIKVGLMLCKRNCYSSRFRRQEEGIDYDEVFALVASIEAIRIFLAFASYMGFIVYQMDVKRAFLYDTIDAEVYVTQPLGFVDPKFPNKVKQKEDGIFISQDKYVAEILKKFDFISVKTASTLIKTQKPLVKDEEAADVDVHLYRSMIAVKRIFMYLKGQPKLGLWYPKVSSFDLEAYSDSDYAGVNLDRKSITGAASVKGRLLKVTTAKLRLLMPNIGVNTPRCDEDSLELKELMVFFVQFVLRKMELGLLLCLCAKTTSWNEFSSTMASAIICLSTNQKFNFSRDGTGFSRVITPLFESMLVQDAKDVGEAQDYVSIPTKPSTSKPHKTHNLKKQQPQAPNVPSPAPSPKYQLPSPLIDPIPTAKDSLTLQELQKLEDRVDQLEEDNRALKGKSFKTTEVDIAAPAKAYNLDLQHAKKVLSMQDINKEEHAKVEEVLKVVKAAKLMTKVVTTAQPTTIATQLPKLSALRKKKGVIIQDPKETATSNDVIEQVKRREKQDNRVMRYQSLKRKHVTEAQAKKNMMIYLKNTAGIKMDFFKEELKTHLHIVANEDDDVYTKAIHVASKVIVVDYLIHYVNNKHYYKIIRADGTHKLFLSVITLLKNFDRDDLETLWKIVKERSESTKPNNFSNDFLLNTFKIMFEKPNVVANVWRDQMGKFRLAKVKSWKLFESCRVYVLTLTTTQMFLLVEKKYPLTHFTLQ
nr:retrovirus-related Pol polyprotein from transposon TNT 1-94 [Tanacetum cinerariifolium]